MTRSIRLALACAVLLAASAPAQAQPTGDKKKALELYEKGNTQYNLGRWKEAIDLFTQAYEVYSAPEFLFNIAQAYRQDANCSEALFFYRRYLANKPNASNKAEVEGFIKELEARCTEGTGGGATSGKPGTGTGTSGTGKTTTGGTGTGGTGGTGSGTSGAGTSGTGGSGTGATTGTGTRTATGPDATVTEEDEIEEEVEEGIETETPSGRPALFTASVAAGPSFLFAGDLDEPVLLAFSVGGGYPLWFDDLGLEPGVLITYTPVPWDGTMEGTSGTSSLIGLLANAAASYPIVPSLPALGVRGELGLGALVMTGLDRYSPFLEDNQFADGAITMFHARVALGAEYKVTPNIAVFAQPVVLSFSPASKLRDEISSLTRYEVLLGAGYRM